MSSRLEERDTESVVSETDSEDWDDPVLQRLARAPALRPPSEFTGTDRFEVLRVIGSGAFGTVYEAVERNGASVVALKVLRTADPERVSRFKREFRGLADITHPNLVRLDELVFDGERWILVMELVRGVPFDVFVGGDPSRLRAAALGLAEGLLALHDAGKLHRDVKPSNVLVEENGRVVLLDFGLVLDAAASVVSEIAGTPRYMAPECIDRERSPGKPSDLYAMGVMLHEALTGHPPSAGASSLAAGQTDVGDLCLELLEPEPSRRPTAREVVRRLRGAPEARDGGGRGRFVGRSSSLREISDAFESVRSGAPRLVLITGEPGVGKSAFLEAAEAMLTARRSDLVWLGGKCREREAMPYKALDGAMEALASVLSLLTEDERRAVLPGDGSDLARQFPVFSGLLPREAPPPGDLARAMAALRELLSRLAEKRPVVVALDDLQWGDADSATVLSELVREPSAPGVLYLGACRQGEAGGSSFLAAFRETETACWAEVSLAPLPDAEALELTRALAGPAVDEQGMERIVREARGNPLFVRELVRLCELGPQASAPTLSEGIRHRVAALPDDARRFLEAAAVADHPERADVIARVAGVEDTRSVTAALRARQLIRVRESSVEDTFECYHDRIRETVRESLPEARVAAIHVALATALAGAHDPDRAAERIARHFVSAGRTHEAAAFAIAAARRAAGSFAHDHARELFLLALELVGAHDPRTWALKEDLGAVLAASGRGGEAADAFLAAAHSAPEARRLDLLRRAASTLLAAGYVDRGLSVLESVLKDLGLRVPRSPLAAVLATIALRVRMKLRGLSTVRRTEEESAPGDVLRVDALRGATLGLIQTYPAIAGALGARHLLSSLDLGVPDRVLPALALEVMFSAFGGFPARTRTLDLVARMERLAAEVDDPAARAWALFGRQVAGFLSARWAESEQLAEELSSMRPESRTVASKTLPDIDLDFVRGLRLNAMYMRRRPGDMQRELPSLLQDLRRRGHRMGVLWLTGYTSYTLTCRDRPAEARSVLSNAMKEWAVAGFHMQSWWEVLATTSFDLYEEDPRKAWEAVSRVWPKLRRGFLLGGEYHRVEARLIRATIALSLAARGGTGAKELVRIALKECARVEREGKTWGRGYVSLLRASVASIRGDDGAADRHLAEGIPLLSEYRIDGVVAVAERARGRLIGGSAGEALTRRAHEWMEDQAIASPERFSAMYLPWRP